MATKRDIEPIISGPVRLRLLEERDLPTTLAWRNQDHIRKWFFNSSPITPEQHRAWWNQYKDRDDDFVFVIEETASLKRPVGQIALYRIDRKNRRAELGRLMIGEAQARGTGVAKAATSLLVDTALTTWELQEVYLEVLETNTPAIRLYTACGFETTDRRDGVALMRRMTQTARSSGA